MEMPPNKSLASSQSLIAPLLREPIERFQLDNGLTVLLKPDTGTALCSVQVWVKTGSIHEGSLMGAGLSHFLEHMLFKGTANREGGEISETVQAAGGYINAYTTFDRTVYYIDIPAENVAVALDILADVVFHSTLPADEVERERDVILREIDMGQDDPDQRLSRSLFETAFKQHPYRYPVIGYRDVFSKTRREDLLDYYNRRYVPNNAVLIVTGEFETASMRKEAEAFFGAIERHALASEFVPMEPVQLAARSSRLVDDLGVSRVAMGYQVPGLSDADTPVLDVLSIVLGNGQSSLLNLRLREELQLVHAIDATNWTPGLVGVFYLALVCDPDRQEEAVAELNRLIAGLAEESFSPQALDKAIRQLLMAELSARKTVSGQASRLGSAEVVVGDLGYTKNYLSRVAKVTVADLVRVARTWLRPDKMTTVSLGPEVPAKALTSSASKRRDWSFDECWQKNGSVLLLRENDRLPSVHIRLVMQAGSLFEPAGMQGLSSSLATMLTKDTEKRTAQEVALAIEALGGSFYEFSGNNSLGLALETLSTDTDLAVDLLEQALFSLRFDQDRFKLEKDSHLAGIREDLDDIVYAGRTALRRLFFGSHPFSVSGSGSLETVGKIQLGDLRSLRQKLLVSGNLALAVSGNFDRAELQPKLEALLSKAESGSLADADVPFTGAARPGQHRQEMDRQQAVVFHAYPGPGLKSPEYYVSEVADEIFSGMSSQLFERVREDLGLAYFVRSSRIVGLDTALFYFYAGTSTEGYPAVISELSKEVARVADQRVRPEELARCQSRLKSARRMSMQTNSACAGQAAMNAAYGLPANDWRDYDRRIDAVSIANLAAFAQKFLVEAQLTELVIGAV